jgi:maltose/maltodextrin transport system substrate-binding protein
MMWVWFNLDGTPPKMRKIIAFLFLAYLSTPAFAWRNGELLLWMDGERARTLLPIIKSFENHFGIKVTTQSPPSIVDGFLTAAQCSQGPDIVFWAHDKVGEWADAGLISPIDVRKDFRDQYFPKAWEAVTYKNQIWGYPIGLETTTLIYNKKLLDGPPPTRLSDLPAIDAQIKKEHPGVVSILWDYKSPYYSWGILASAGAYIFAKYQGDYDFKNVGIANPGAVEALSKLTGLVNTGLLPKSVSYSVAEDLMGRGKLAMMISGPWAWSNLLKSGIDFGVAPIPGVGDQPAKPFVGVAGAYINRSSPNQDLAREFLQSYLLTREGLIAIDSGKPIGIPALITLADEYAKKNELLNEMKRCAEEGEVTPNIPEMSRFWTSVGAALQIATNGQASPENALKEAESTMQHP